MSERELVAIEEREKKYFEIVFDIFSDQKYITFINKSMKSINTHLKSV